MTCITNVAYYSKALNRAYKGQVTKVKIFFVILFLLPVIEIALFINVGGAIGVGNTILLCILAGLAGVFVLKIQGVRTLMAMQEVSRRGQVPLQQMFDGFCLSVAGLFLMVPGFFSDIIAFALMMPFVRAGLREVLIRGYGFREMTPAEEDIIDAEFMRVEVERITKDD